MNDTAWKVLLLIKMILGLDARLLDVEAAFQNGDLDVEIYMEPPDGLEEFWEIDKKTECLQSIKYNHGLVQAVRQYSKNLTR